MKDAEAVRFLIIGASGFLGQTVYAKLKEQQVPVTGTCLTHKPAPDMIGLDVMNAAAVAELFWQCRPDVIVWSVMNHAMEDSFAEAAIRPLLSCLHGERFLFLSTNVATHENMTENVTPVIRKDREYNYRYFNGKIRQEHLVRAYDNHCIIRPGSIYGRTPYGMTDVRYTGLKQHVDRKEPFERAVNIRFPVVEVNDLADVILELASSTFTGIINVSEESPVSHYDFNVQLCRENGWDHRIVIAQETEPLIYSFDNTLRKKVLEKRLRNDS